MAKHPKVHVGDIVALTWEDICSWGRVTGSSVSEFPLAVFVSYGEVAYSDNERLTILSEKEIDNVTGSPTIEPTVFPWGCIRKVVRLRPVAGSASAK